VPVRVIVGDECLGVDGIDALSIQLVEDLMHQDKQLGREGSLCG
jgi:hypothetical protein